MKKISVNLTEYAEAAMYEIMKVNDCTASDTVNMALMAFAADKSRVTIASGLYDELNDKCRESGSTIENWCYDYNVDINKMKYFCKQVDKGKQIIGFGNYKNKKRDKEETVKTETARIALLVKGCFGVETK